MHKNHVQVHLLGVLKISLSFVNFVKRSLNVSLCPQEIL